MAVLWWQAEQMVSCRSKFTVAHWGVHGMFFFAQYNLGSFTQSNSLPSLQMLDASNSAHLSCYGHKGDSQCRETQLHEVMNTHINLFRGLPCISECPGGAQVFDASSRALLRQLKGHKQPAHVAQFAPDRLHVLSAADDASVRLPFP